MLFTQTLANQVSIGVVEDTRLLTDEALLELALKNPSVFEVLLERYQSSFLSRAQGVVGDRDRAEDVVQDTFVRIYRFAPRFKGEEGSFRAWALTILMNVARTHYARGARDRGRTATLEPDHYESLKDDSIHAKEGNENYAKEVIQKALALAPKDVSEILTLGILEDLPYAEIATRLGITVAAVKTRVHRAKAAMRDIIIKNNLQ
jgi:RNA polymerase sigma-70 factor (ECF subfamily)